MRPHKRHTGGVPRRRTGPGAAAIERPDVDERRASTGPVVAKRPLPVSDSHTAVPVAAPPADRTSVSDSDAAESASASDSGLTSTAGRRREKRKITPEEKERRKAKKHVPDTSELLRLIDEAVQETDSKVQREREREEAKRIWEEQRLAKRMAKKERRKQLRQQALMEAAAKLRSGQPITGKRKRTIVQEQRQQHLAGDTEPLQVDQKAATGKAATKKLKMKTTRPPQMHSGEPAAGDGSRSGSSKHVVWPAAGLMQVARFSQSEVVSPSAAAKMAMVSPNAPAKSALKKRD